MQAITFPFCVVTSHQADISLPVVPSDVTGYVAAFSTVEKASAYMMAAGRTNWQLWLVSRPTFDSLVEMFRQLGVKGFCFDPSQDECGVKLDFDEIK
jgi:hypothetical protein